MPAKPMNLQQRIFALIRDIGLTNGQKYEICKARYGKTQVCLLNREQGLDLEAALQEHISKTAEDAYKALAVAPTPTEVVQSAK
jgi:N12 class adenine-specific DNA methylase